MLLLALETASELGSVALCRDARLLAELSFGAARHHAASLLPAIEQVLAHAQERLAAVDAIALSVGPGSFTGLRVGLATALGLCFGTGRPIVPVPTLAALSLHAGPEGKSVPMLDARRGQVYAGLYAPGGAPLCPDRVADPGPWLEGLRGEGPLRLLGPGARLYRNEVESILGGAATLLPAALGTPRAWSVARLGLDLAKAGGALPAAQVRLEYLRPSEAEERPPARDSPGGN